MYLARRRGLTGLAIIHGRQAGQVESRDAVERVQRVEYRRRRSHRRRRRSHCVSLEASQSYRSRPLRETYSST